MINKFRNPASLLLTLAILPAFGQSTLVLELPFNGDANDNSTYENHGTVFGATLTEDRFGNENSAYLFDGIDDYIEVQDDASLNPENITIAAWVKVESTSHKAPEVLRKSTYEDATNEEYYLRLASDVSPQTGVKTTGTCNYAPSSWNTITSDADVILSEWHFLTATFDSLSLKIYLDGEFQNEFTLASPRAINNCGNGNVRIGMAWKDNLNHFKGVIDDIKIFNVALDSCAIQALYHEGDMQDLVAYFPFNGNANDESMNANNGILYGPVPAEDRFGNAASAYYFDGVNDYIEVLDDPSLNPGNITLAAWIKPELASSGSPEIIRKSTYSDATNEQYYLRLALNNMPQTGVKASTTCNYSPDDWTVNNSNTSISLNGWHFISTTFDSESLKIYIDGELINEEVLPGPLDINNCVGGNLRFGLGWETYQNYFKGTIDDIRIYKRALSSCEISNLFHENEYPDVITAINKSNIANQSIHIYPNPAKGDFLVVEDVNLKDLSYEIRGVDGIQLAQGLNDGKINIANLESGIYILTIYDLSTNSTLSQRFIIQ